MDFRQLLVEKIDAIAANCVEAVHIDRQISSADNLPSGGDKRPLSPDAKRVLPGKPPRQIPSLLTMKQGGATRLVTSRILCVVKKNGLIVETRPLSKCCLNSIKGTWKSI